MTSAILIGFFWTVAIYATVRFLLFGYRDRKRRKIQAVTRKLAGERIFTFSTSSKIKIEKPGIHGQITGIK